MSTHNNMFSSASLTQSDVHPTGDHEVTGSIPTGSGKILFVEVDHEIFSLIILSLPLIQERQLSVFGETNMDK